MIILAEDVLAESVALRIVRHLAPDVEITVRLRGGGYEFVRQRLRKLNEAAPGYSILALLDRDVPSRCPIEIITSALGGPRHPNFVIRFANMEIESWIMADAEQFAQFLSITPNRIPAQTDDIADPKQFLVNLARKSRIRDIRSDICPVAGSIVQIGPAYNQRLEEFVHQRWRPGVASERSTSLATALKRIRALVDMTKG